MYLLLNNHSKDRCIRVGKMGAAQINKLLLKHQSPDLPVGRAQ